MSLGWMLVGLMALVAAALPVQGDLSVRLDLESYRSAVLAASAHQPIYLSVLDYATTTSANPYLYPPSALLVLWPLGVLPAPVAAALWFGMSAVAVIVSVRLVLTRLGRDVGAASSWRILAWVLLTWGVFYGLRLGQVGPLLLVLCALDLLWRPESRWSGSLIGIAAAIKITPAVFLIWLWVTGRRRAALVGAAVWVSLTGVAWALMGADSARFWLDGTVIHPPRSITPDATNNQSVAAWIYRLTGHSGSVSSMAIAVIVTVSGIWAARRLARHGAPISAVTLVGVVSAAAAPIGWTHQWVWCPLLVVALWHEVGTATARWLTVGVGVVLTVPIAQAFPWWFITPTDPLLARIASGAYVIATTLAVVAAVITKRAWTRPSALPRIAETL